MKKYFFIFLTVFLFNSCNKDDDFIGGHPNILLEKNLPSEMDNYSNYLSNPLLYGEFLIIASSNYQENKSTFFKLNRSGEFVDKWNVNNTHLLGNYIHHNEVYLYNNQLIYNSKYFGVTDQKIISINLDNMETNWEVPSSNYRSGLFFLNNKVYLNKYITNGYEIYSVNLDNQNVELDYQVTNGSYGNFVMPHHPYIYEIDNNNIGVLITSSNNDSYTLINYNITTQNIIWEVNLNEFSDVDAPTDVQLYDTKIIITSNSYVSVRNLLNADYFWSKERNYSTGTDKPLIGSGIIADSADKLYCYNLQNGVIKWKREHQQDGIWVGKNDGKIIYKNYLFDDVPINIETGKAKWVKLDSWGELDLNFSGKPGIDYNTDELFYIGNRTNKLYKVMMPHN